MKNSRGSIEADRDGSVSLEKAANESVFFEQGLFDCRRQAIRRSVVSGGGLVGREQACLQTPKCICTR